MLAGPVMYRQQFAMQILHASKEIVVAMSVLRKGGQRASWRKMQAETSPAITRINARFWTISFNGMSHLPDVPYLPRLNNRRFCLRDDNSKNGLFGSSKRENYGCALRRKFFNWA